MAKILFIVSTLQRTGPTNQLYNIVSNIELDRYEICIVTLSPEKKDSRWEDFAKLNIYMQTLGGVEVIDILSGFRRLKAIVDHIKPDIVHTHGVRSDFLSACFFGGTSRVSTLRSFPQQDYPMTYGFVLGKVMQVIHVLALRKLDFVVSVSESVQRNANAILKIYHTVLIRNGVDTERFSSPSPQWRGRCRQTLGLPSAARIWLSVGHLSRRKDPLSVIRAFKVFSKARDDMLVLVGDGDLESECRMLAAADDSIQIRGRVNNVVEYLQAADYFVSTSRAEGFPNAALEALSCGLPLLLSDIEPHMEIFKLDSNVGVYYQGPDDASLLDAFQRLVDRDYLSMKRSALRLINAQLSAGSMSQKYQALYSEVVSR